MTYKLLISILLSSISLSVLCVLSIISLVPIHGTGIGLGISLLLMLTALYSTMFLGKFIFDEKENKK